MLTFNFYVCWHNCGGGEHKMCKYNHIGSTVFDVTKGTNHIGLKMFLASRVFVQYNTKNTSGLR